MRLIHIWPITIYLNTIGIRPPGLMKKDENKWNQEAANGKPKNKTVNCFPSKNILDVLSIGIKDMAFNVQREYDGTLIINVVCLFIHFCN